MKMTTLKSVAIAVGLASPAFGQAATSPVVGYYTETLNQGFNAVGVSLHEKVTTSGTFTAELTDTTQDFTALLADADATYLLEITSGAQNGAVAVITDFTATSLTVEGGTDIGAGTSTYTIREAATLNEIFGDTLVGSTFVGPTTDIVFVPNGTGGFDQFANNTGGNGGEGQFRNTAGGFFTQLDEEVILFYPDGVFVQQASATPNDLVISGALKTTGTVVAAESGFNLVASPAPVGATLGNSGLQDSLTGAGFVGPTTDILFLPNGSGFTEYAFNTSASEWRLTSAFFGASQNDVVLPSAFFIQRNGDSTAALAETPDFFANL